MECAIIGSRNEWRIKADWTLTAVGRSYGSGEEADMRQRMAVAREATKGMPA